MAVAGGDKPVNSWVPLKGPGEEFPLSTLHPSSIHSELGLVTDYKEETCPSCVQWGIQAELSTETDAWSP